MPILADTHLHTSFSADSDTPMEEQVKAAILQGLSTICFTEHLDLDSPFVNSPDWEILDYRFDHDEYRREYERIRDLYRDRIEIRFGIELGLVSRMEKEILSYMRTYRDYDFVIGSNHSSRGSMDPYYDSFFEGITPEEAYRCYFEDSLENVRTLSCFDSLGHLDFVLRCGPQKADGSSPERMPSAHYLKYKDVIDQILKTLIENGKALEVNTGALFKKLPEPHPCREILRTYRELGGELITIGSDAHVPHHIAYAFPEVREMLTDLGFRYYAVFRERKPEMLPL